MAALSHPNIVSIHDVQRGDPAYFIMEFIDGEGLRELVLRETQLPDARALTIGLALADALAHAHERGVIHRDVKPENVMISKRGRVVLLDFGLVKLLDGISLTAPQMVLGTLGYMAPEQIEATPVDGRIDVYALGVMLYEMVSGVRPSEGTGLRNPLFRPPRSSADIQTVHPRFAAVIDRAMSFDREDRYASAREMHLALRDARRAMLRDQGLLGGDQLRRVLGQLARMHNEVLVPLETRLSGVAEIAGSDEEILEHVNQPQFLDEIGNLARELEQQIAGLGEGPAEVADTIQRLDATRIRVGRIARGASGRGFARPTDVHRARSFFGDLAAHLMDMLSGYRVDLHAVATQAAASSTVIPTNVVTAAAPDWMLATPDHEALTRDLTGVIAALIAACARAGSSRAQIILHRHPGGLLLTVADAELSPERIPLTPPEAGESIRSGSAADELALVRQVLSAHGGQLLVDHDQDRAFAQVSFGDAG